jgi:hypothetical protein
MCNNPSTSKSSNTDVLTEFSFPKDNYQIHLLSWNKNYNNDLTKWIKSGKVVEIEKWIYIDKAELKRQRQVLDSFTRPLDLISINLADMHDEIISLCHLKGLEMEDVLDDFFVKSNNSKVTIPFYRLFYQIINQPSYLIEASIKYGNNLNDSQKTYYRYKFLDSKLDFGKDNFADYRMELRKMIRSDISSDSKQFCNSIFLFVEQFIDELKSLGHTQYDYFNSPLFKRLFREIIGYKEYYQAAFDQFNFANITEIEESIKSVEPDSCYKLFPSKNKRCTSISLKDNINQLCENCPIPEKIKEEISNKVLFSVKKQKQSLNANDYYNYLLNEMEKARNVMDTINEMQEIYQSNVDNPDFTDLISDYLFNKEKIATINNAIEQSGLLKIIESSINELPRKEMNQNEAPFIRVTAENQAGSRYEIVCSCPQTGDVTSLVSGFCVYYLWKKQQAEEEKLNSGFYPYWDKNDIFNEYYNGTRLRCKKENPSDVDFDEFGFILNQIFQEQKNLDSLFTISNFVLPVQADQIRKWNTNFIDWLNARLNRPDILTREEVKKLSSKFECTVNDYEGLYPVLLQDFIRKFDGVEYDFIVKEIIEFQEILFLTQKDQLIWENPKDRRTSIIFRHADEVVKKIGQEKFNFSTNRKIEFLILKKAGLAFGYPFADNMHNLTLSKQPAINSKMVKTGFNSDLSDSQIEILFDFLLGSFIDEKTEIGNFINVFKNSELPNFFMPVKWIHSYRGKPNQTSLREFLKVAMCFDSQNPPQTLIDNCFSDAMGNPIIIAKYKRSMNTERWNKKFRLLIQ